MKKIDNLIIVGDSYCVSRHPDSHYDWPVILSKLLDCKLLGRGHGGVSWWTGERNFHNLHEWEFGKASTVIDIMPTLNFKIFK